MSCRIQRLSILLALATLVGALLAAPAVAQPGRGPGDGTCLGTGPQGQGPQGPQGQGPQGPQGQGRGPYGGGPYGGGPWGRGGGGCGGCALLDDYVASLPPGSLDAQETAAILRNREEEKLARDVYRALAAKWNLRAFYHIAAAEERHMDHVLALVERYGLADPVADDRPGAFTDPSFAGLYEQLVTRGEVSLVAALEVGATIEDMDLNDLATSLASADDADLRAVYQNLTKASRNHLRAFVSLLDAEGATYAAQYLGADEVAAIVAAPRERGFVYDENGEVLGTCGGRGRGRGPRG